MKKIDIVGIAFGNFKRRKTRSLLTVLGVVIGVASIVVMVSLGIAVNVFFEEQTSQMGDLTTVRVYAGWDPQTGQQKGSLDDEMVEKLKGIANVDAVIPQIEFGGKVVANKHLTYTSIIGVPADVLNKLGLKVETGSIEGFEDTSKKDIKCVFGSEVAYQMYNPREVNRGGMGGMMGGSMSFGGSGEQAEREPPPVDVMSDDTKVRFTFDWNYGEKKQPGVDNGPVKKPVLYKMTPVAVLKPNSGESYSVYIDIDVAKQLKKDQQKQEGNMNGGNRGKPKTESYDSIRVIAKDMEDTVEITKKIQKEFGLEAGSSGEYISGIKNTADMLQLILGGIGAISLLVAAIGIANTMLMSIYERTREIGVMKVIGCQLKDIRTMFLFEAGFIGLFGGAAGLAISYGISYVINKVTASGGSDILGGMLGMMSGGNIKMSIIPMWLSVVAVTFAILVGVISGFLPARRAMKLSALEAMRT